MIRRATRDDLPAMLGELRRHHEEQKFEWRFDAPRLSMLLAHAVAAPDWLVLTGDGVLLMARWFECEFGSGRHAIERILRVARPGQRRAVQAIYESWARDHGCVNAALGSIERHAAFARLYATDGYRPAEVTYVKAL